MYYLRQSTASQEVLLGPFVDDTDGKTAETALSIANTDIKIHKAGATTLASKNSGGATHISNGNYYAVLDATDTNTVGSGAIIVQVSGALPFRMEFTVLLAQVYDSLIAGSDLLDISVVQMGGSALSTSSAQIGVNVIQAAGTAWGSGAITAAAIASNAITSAKIATDAIGAAQIAANAIGASEIAADAIGASELAADAVNEIVEALLKYDLSTVTGESARSMLNALRAIRNKVSIAGGTMTVTKEDDTTSAWTAAVVTSPGDPISSVDPA